MRRKLTSAIEENRLEDAKVLLSGLPDIPIDEVATPMRHELGGKSEAIEFRERGYTVEHIGRDRYVATKKLRKRDVLDMRVIHLAVSVLLTNSEALVKAFPQKLVGTEPALSYLLYRYLLTLQSRQKRCKEYDKTIQLLVDRGARFTTAVIASQTIFVWAILKNRWDIVRFIIKRLSPKELLESDVSGKKAIGFDILTGVEYWPFESLFEYAIAVAPPDIVLSMIKKGYSIDNIMDRALLYLSNSYRRVLHDYCKELLETTRRELEPQQHDRDSIFQWASTNSKIHTLERFLSDLGSSLN